MNRVAAAFAIVVTLVTSSATRAQMGPGAVEIGKGAACYNPATGEIIISMNDVDVWYIESFSSSLTGATPIFPRPASLTGDNDGRIGQTDFGPVFTFTDYNLGPVAALGLLLTDLVVGWSPNIGGSPEMRAPVTLCVPEPATLPLLLIWMGILFRKHRRLLT